LVFSIDEAQNRVEKELNRQMKVLVLEDDFGCRLVLQRALSGFGEVHVAVTGSEALSAYNVAQAEGVPYDLICLDIMVPEVSGLSVLQQIRSYESEHGAVPAKILMTTAVGSKDDVVAAIRGGCDGYLVKPIEKAKLMAQLKKWHLLT
jgi:two-component system chemotaxis response regulator CheY